MNTSTSEQKNTGSEWIPSARRERPRNTELKCMKVIEVSTRVRWGAMLRSEVEAKSICKVDASQHREDEDDRAPVCRRLSSQWWISCAGRREREIQWSRQWGMEESKTTKPNTSLTTVTPTKVHVSHRKTKGMRCCNRWIIRRSLVILL